MKRASIILFCLVCCCSCSRGKYFVTDIFRRGNAANLQVLQLDSTYHLYLRQVFKDKNLLRENVLKSNVAVNDTANKTRIEVEYLLLSAVHKNVIYITTIPDRYQHYYSKYYIADTLMNAYDFNTFHFGKFSADGEGITFISGDEKRILNWDIRPFINGQYPEKVFIREISSQLNDIVDNVILINKALDEPLSFTLQNNFSIFFKTPSDRSDTGQMFVPFNLSERKIFFNQVKSGFDVYFHFNSSIEGSKDSAIGFDARRTRYSPEKILP